MKIVSIIPARGDSKGLPRKNIIDLAGKPLIAYTIESSLTSKYITKTIVSSDDDEILDISVQFGAEILKRPAELAQDTTSSEAVITHVLNNIEHLNEYDYLILLQPTSPLRSSKHIDSAFKQLLNSDADALISICHNDKKILKSFLLSSNGYLGGIVNDEYPFMRRQELPNVYMPNGAIYIIKVKSFLRHETLLTKKTLPFLMSNIISIDIDKMSDIVKAEKYMNNNMKFYKTT